MPRDLIVSGDLPPSPLKYNMLVLHHVREAEEVIDDIDEGVDCSWEEIYRLYGCSPLYA